MHLIYSESEHRNVACSVLNGDLFLIFEANILYLAIYTQP